MARPLRIEYEGAFYHVTSRDNERERIFYEKSDYVASSATIGDNYAIFEPTHGSAPKYAGTYKVNPMAMLLTTRLMLDYLGEAEKAATLEKAIARVIREGKVRTYDMGESSTTLEVAEAVASHVEKVIG